MDDLMRSAWVEINRLKETVRELQGELVQFRRVRHATFTFPPAGDAVDIVQVHHSGANLPGDDVEANADGYHPAILKQWNGSGFDDDVDVWVRFVDDHDTNEGDVDAVEDEYYGPAKLEGSVTSQSVEKPLYLVRVGAEAAQFEILTGQLMVEDLEQLSFATVDEVTWDANDSRTFTGRRFEVWDLKLNDGESIPQYTIIDFCRDNINQERYKWLTALCDDADPVQETPPSVSPGYDNSGYSNSPGFGPMSPTDLQTFGAM